MAAGSGSCVILSCAVVIAVVVVVGVVVDDVVGGVVVVGAVVVVVVVVVVVLTVGTTICFLESRKSCSFPPQVLTQWSPVKKLLPLPSQPLYLKYSNSIYFTYKSMYCTFYN
jgi:hypothetical protein